MRSTKIFSSIFAATFCFTLSCFAQTQKKASLADDSQVSYGLNEAKKLNGPYTISRSNGDKISLRGSYNDGERVGNWYAFNDDGNVFLRYNYDQKKLVFLDTTSINRLRVEVLTKDEDSKAKATIPVPISSIDEYVSLLGTEAKRLLLAENKNAEGILDVDLISRIDDKGRPNYEAMYLADGIPVTKRLIISERNFDLDWIPASFEDKTYASVFTVKARINFSETEPGKKRFIWAY